MKKISLFSFALAGLMLGACSSETELVTSNQGPEWNANGKGYVNLAIQLPTQPSSRADAAGGFADGTPAEYQVNDATLILFVTDEQGKDVINSAYDMDLNFSSVGQSNDQITTTSKITQEINEIENPSAIKALVVLNNNGLLKVGEKGSLSDKNGNTLIGATLDGLNGALKSLDDNFSWHDDGFLMSNAVLATSTNIADLTTVTKVDPLVPIDVKKICSTKAEAEANPAATIYVERAEAKITVNDASDKKTSSGLPFEIVGWGIDNYNKTNRLVRTTSSFDTWKNYVSAHVATTTPTDYRFLGTTPIATNLYRFYWGDDYNYESNVDGDLQSISSLDLTADGADAAYCFENTTNVENMLETTLTRVIVKAKFNEGQPFYIADDDNTKIWQANTTDLTNEIINRMLKDVTFANWVNTNTTGLVADDFTIGLGTTAGDVTNDITVTLKEDAENKLINGATIEEAKAQATTAAKNHIKLTYYDGGIAYYPVYIKHFSEEQTPWNKNYPDVTATSIYEGYNEQNYLGRYGVLRNNWYDITVNSIKGLGSAVIEDPDPVPVDKVESYISVDINILSWAKRTQDVNL